MLKDPVIRKSVVASVIATVLTIIFIKPILNFLTPFVLNFLGFICVGFVDHILKNAALGHRNEHAPIILTILLLGALEWTTLRLLSSYKKKETDEEHEKRVKKFRPQVIVFLIIFYPIILLMIITDFADLSLNTVFQQRMTILSPVLSDQDEEEIQAMWAAMTCKSDYNAINTKITALAKKHKITLPKMSLK